MTAGRTLSLLVREPKPGEVKTRLGPALGAGGAALLYRASPEDLSAKLVDEMEREAFAPSRDGGVSLVGSRELLRKDPESAPATARALNALVGAFGSKDRR